MREVTKQNLSILSITLLLGGTIYVFINFINPLLQEDKYIRRKIVETQKKIQLLQEYKSKSESLIQSYLNMGEEVEKIHYALPNDSQTAQVLAIIDELAKRNSIFIGGLTFQEKREKGYKILQTKLNFTTTYETGKAFLGSLERELRLIDVDKITIKTFSKGKAATTKKKRGKKTKKVVSPDLDFDIVISTYFLGEEENK